MIDFLDKNLVDSNLTVAIAQEGTTISQSIYQIA